MVGLRDQYFYFFTCCVVNELAMKLIHTQDMLLDLPSSASAVDFADDTNNDLKVRLPLKLVLEPSELEVSAMVAHIPNKLYNIVAGEVTLLSHSSRAEQTYSVTPGF